MFVTPDIQNQTFLPLISKRKFEDGNKKLEFRFLPEKCHLCRSNTKKVLKLYL